MPFDQIPNVLAHMLGLGIDGEMVRRLTEKFGSWAESQEQEVIQAAACGNTPVLPTLVPSTFPVVFDPGWKVSMFIMPCNILGMWPADSLACQTWSEEVLHQLRHTGGRVLEAVWQALSPLSATAQKIVTTERAYFAFHHDCLDHPHYRLAGFPIGSGIIESACKMVRKQRESGSGMRWEEIDAQAIATSRVN